MKTAKCPVISTRLALVLMTVFSCCLLVLLGRNSRREDNGAWINSQSYLGSRFQWTAGLWSRTGGAVGADRDNSGGILLIPDDQQLETLNEQQLATLYWKYVNTIQGLCRNQTRLGSFKDGGKEICIDNEFIPKKPCLVYSFGSNFQFDFELAVINAFGCDVHTFDPSMNLSQKGKTVPSNVHFQLKGLDGLDHLSPKGWELRTLDTIMKELDHQYRTIDILKIDIDGPEWTALPQMFKTGTLQRAKQLSIEVHYGPMNPGMPNWGGVSSRDQLKVLRGLYNEGFRIFMRERNLYSLGPFESDYNNQYTNVNELSLVNLKYKKS